MRNTNKKYCPIKETELYEIACKDCLINKDICEKLINKELTKKDIRYCYHCENNLKEIEHCINCLSTYPDKQFWVEA
jgi:hypothetical protein